MLLRARLMAEHPPIAGLDEAMAKIGDRALTRMDIVADRLTREDAEALLEYAIHEQGQAYEGSALTGPRRLANAQQLRDLAVAAVLVLSGRWPHLWLEPA